MMKITLQVNGREMTFSESELVDMAENYFPNKVIELTAVPTEGKCFEVNPTAINRQLFQSERSDLRQERTRQLILEAFVEVDANPERYGCSFKTLIPERNWTGKNFEELEVIAQKIGNHMADWIEQALEWAQRISNGESWSAVCNDRDTANCYRAIIWKNGFILVGGSVKYNNSNPPSDVNLFDDYCYSIFNYTVPLVVLY